MEDAVRAPDFGPTAPTYPAINSFVRTSAPSIGNNVYPGFSEQAVFDSSGVPSFRDREPVFLWEPNGVVLGPGYYDARLLVGNYQGRPLYATHCCPGTVFSSSRSAVASSPGPAASSASPSRSSQASSSSAAPGSDGIVFGNIITWGEVSFGE